MLQMVSANESANVTFYIIKDTKNKDQIKESFYLCTRTNQNIQYEY